MEKLGGGEEKVGPVGRGKKGKERGERAGFRLQIYWRAFSQAGLHLTFSSASSVDSQPFPSHCHGPLHLPAANCPGFLNEAEPGAAGDPKGFWMGFIQVTDKEGSSWLNILGEWGRERHKEQHSLIWTLPSKPEAFQMTVGLASLSPRRKCINNHICYALLKNSERF